ncbi:MAG: helix-turn-helix domain-containing protein [Candidatus Thiodiazotropha sp. (ex Ustalcina ferruginea)]|nr:helix-turn-helix domain-containing protein [Candidatus Thiodiazotropha sp. (ex Ustalcina ferruginea)]
MNLQQWLNESRENQIGYAEEGLILDVTEAIWELLQAKNISKAELANRMGKSKGFVSQILNGSRNMTLRTLADIAFALDANPKISLLEENGTIQWAPLGTVVHLNHIQTAIAGQDTEWSEPTSLSTRPSLKAVG